MGYIDTELSKEFKKLQEAHRELLIESDYMRQKLQRQEAQIKLHKDLGSGDMVAISREMYDRIKKVALELTGFTV